MFFIIFLQFNIPLRTLDGQIRKIKAGRRSPGAFFVVYITVLNITKKVLFAIVQCIKLRKWFFGDINEKG